MATPPARSQSTDPIRVMVVDDSAVIRGLLTRTLEGDPDIRVTASVGDGQMAINSIRRQPVDVVILDIEMPVMDGLTALPQIVAAAPQTKVLMASTLTKRNADISLKALSAGAADYVAKPTATRDIHGAGGFKDELIQKVKVLGAVAREARGPAPRTGFKAERPAARAAPAARPAVPARIVLREMPASLRPDVIAIGSSTGGPQALFELLTHLARGVTQPVLVTQHMPATFTTILAEHITRQCGLPAHEGRDGEPIVGGQCYVAPGNHHMTVAVQAGGPTIRLNQDPPENFCRPAVDAMLRGAVAAYGRKMLVIILTGMGQDGLKGCGAVVKAGGVVLAQDEATSVVWGMPGAVATAGLCAGVMPIKDIGPFVRRLVLRSAA